MTESHCLGDHLRHLAGKPLESGVFGMKKGTLQVEMELMWGLASQRADDGEPREAGIHRVDILSLIIPLSLDMARNLDLIKASL